MNRIHRGKDGSKSPLAKLIFAVALVLLVGGCLSWIMGEAHPPTADKFCYDCHRKFWTHPYHQHRTCEQCHGRMQLHPVTNSATCFSCHAEDDGHEGQRGTACMSCHFKHGFAWPHFDHNNLYVTLTGGHAGLACTACHNDETAVSPPDRRCAGCHPGADYEGSTGCLPYGCIY